MKQQPEIDPRHTHKRKFLRVAGPLVLLTGAAFLVVALVDFFAAMAGHGAPNLFWCGFIALPLLWLGTVLASAGFIGAAHRYLAGESAPVAKDTFNYLADGTQDGLKTVATAVGQGLAAGMSAAPPQVRCHKCNAPNEPASKFCRECGAALGKTKPCPACNELNDPDAKFCDECGRAL